MAVEEREGVPFRVGQPALAQPVSVIPQVLEQGPAFFGRDSARVRRHDPWRHLLRYDEEGVAHREQPNQRDVLVEGLFHLGDARLAEPGTGGEEDGGRVGGMQGDHGVGDRDGGRCPRGRGQQVTAADSDAALFVADAVHSGLLGCRCRVPDVLGALGAGLRVPASVRERA